MRELLYDGHGRSIGDVRISVTDRCNFRCQYCMPAEGLPWLDRDELLTYEEIARRGRPPGEHGRPRRPADRRRAAGPARAVAARGDALSADENVHDLSLTTNGYLLERQVEKLVEAGLRRVNVSLDALAPDRFFQLTRRNSLQQVLDSLAAAERYPELRPIKVNVVALKDFTEDEVVRFAEFARKHPYEVRFIEFMPLDADRTWSRDRVLPNAEVRRLIHAAYPLKDLGRERHGTSRRWEFADGQGSIGFISPVSEPFCGDCNRIRVTAEGKLRTCLFSMTETDLRGADARRRVRRRARGDRPRRGVGEGAQAPRERSGLRAAGSHDVADRRMKDLDEALALVLEGIEPLETETIPLPEARGRVIAAEAHAAIDLPPFDRTAMDGFAVRAADVAPGAELRVIGDLAAGGATVAVEPGTAARISTGAAIPEGADSILKVEDAEVRNGSVIAARRRSRAGLHVRRRGEDLHAGDVLARPGRRADRPAAVRAGLGGRGGGARAAAPAPGPDRHRQRTPARGRAARAGQDLRVQLARGDVDGRPRWARTSSTTRRSPTTSRPPGKPSSAAWRATSWSSPAASRSARTTTSSPRSRPAASRRSSGACGSSPASRCGSAAAARRSCSGCRATRCRRSSAPRCS